MSGLVLMNSAAVVASASRPLSHAARCGLLQAIVGVPHSGAHQALRDLECVKRAWEGRDLVVRATLVEQRGTWPLLAAGERCTVERLVGLASRRLSRRAERAFVEVRVVTRSSDEMTFSVVLETWGGAAPGPSCGASGEGVVVRDGSAWRVR